MRLDQVIHGIALADRRGRFDCEVTGITPDSRRIKPGNLFVAVRGTTSDGHQFLSEAIKRGAGSVIAESWPDDAEARAQLRPHVVIVPNSRRALALAAANYYGQPSRHLLVAGVTGTNGKTTVTYVLESIMRAASRRVGVIGTVECRFAGKRILTDHTTPDAVSLQRTLAEMRDAGVTHVVMEVSSHALDQQRVAGVNFKVAGFTNLTQDHLDYHQTLEAYFQAKARLFSESLRKSRARGRMAVVNVDDPRGPELVDLWGGKSLRVSMQPESDADVCLLEMSTALDGSKFVVRTPKGVWDLQIPLVGAHNVSNVLIAMGMALSMGFSKARIVRGLRAIERVPGRLEPVPNDEVKRVFVDYAHTPDALERVLGALRPLTKGRLIVVFGCGGDRDREKRPLMGRAVARVADLAIITNDNPRTEDPVAIAQAIEGGMAAEGWARMELVPRAKTFRVELDRRVAIRVAIGWLEADDVLVLAGKGHEDYQIVGKEKRHFDDREEAWRILAGLPPPLPEAAAGTNDLATSVDDAQVIDALDLATPSARSMPTTEIHADDIEQILEAEPPGAEDGNGEAEDVDAEQVEAIVSAPAMPVILAVAPSTGSARAEAEVVSSDAEKTGPRADALKPPPVAAVGPPEDPKT